MYFVLFFCLPLLLSFFTLSSHIFHLSFLIVRCAIKKLIVETKVLFPVNFSVCDGVVNFQFSLIEHNIQHTQTSTGMKRFSTRRSDYFVAICIDYNQNPIDLEVLFSYVGVMHAYCTDKYTCRRLLILVAVAMGV